MHAVGLYRIVWIPSAIALISMIALFSKQPTTLPEPESMEAYTNSEKTVAFNKPRNWKVGGVSLHSIVSTITLEPERNIRLEIVSDLAGSLVADISRSSNNQASSLASMLPGGQNLDLKLKSPLESAHEAGGKVIEALLKIKQYVEEKGTPAKVAGLDTLVSDFTFKEGGFMGSTDMVGRRFTLLGKDRRYSITYQYPKSAQNKIRPIFEQVIESLKLEQGG